jgi:hypothetical protein
MIIPEKNTGAMVIRYANTYTSQHKFEYWKCIPEYMFPEVMTFLHSKGVNALLNIC